VVEAPSSEGLDHRTDVSRSGVLSGRQRTPQVRQSAGKRGHGVGPTPSRWRFGDEPARFRS